MALVLSQAGLASESVTSRSLSSRSALAILDDPWAKEQWIHRVATKLRNGRGIQTAAEMKKFMPMEPDAIIDEMMKDPSFADTLYAYTHYLISGERFDRVRPETFSFTLFPQALHATRELIRGKDYFSFASLKPGKIYVPPLGGVFRLPGDENYTYRELRLRAQAKIDQAVTMLIEEVRRRPEMPVEEFRLKFQNFVYFPFYDLGLGFQVNTIINWSGTWLGLVDRQLSARGDLPVAVEKDTIVAALTKIREYNAKLWRVMEGMEGWTEKPKTVLDLREIDLSFAEPKMWGYSGHPELFNSSTNFNRKRAAFILKNYFCDDLTPVNVVVAPGEHTGGRHASDPACYSCHYKLDPMAGFFRNFGAQFYDISAFNKFKFDDQAVASTAEYMANWKAPEGSGREWNVGYIRSSTDPSQNSYGSSLSDLHEILRTAPEVRSCMVKKMLRFMVGESQAIDAGYEDYLTQKFVANLKTSHRDAMYGLMAEISKSKSFVVPDPVPGTCYDFPPGYDPVGKPPCSVSFILQKNCVGCHSADLTFGGLDLSKWVLTSNGQMSFPHIKEGVQQTKARTFSSLIERVTATDPAQRMPLNRYLSSDDQSRLYLWFEEQSKEANKP